MSDLSPLVLAELHLDLLYTRNDAGRLTGSRDPDVATPFFHLIRTTQGNCWVISSALTAEQHSQLTAALVAEPVIDDLNELEAQSPVLGGVRALFAAEAAVLVEERGPVFLFGDKPLVANSDAEVVREPHTLLTVPELAWVRDVGPSAHPLAVARNEVGDAVAVCHSARLTPGAAEAGVETARDYRGRGLAGAVVLVWAAAVLAEDRLPIYSTQWTNQASRAVARKLGLVMLGEDYHLA